MSNPTLTVEADIDDVPHPLIARFLLSARARPLGKIDEHTRAANPAAAAGARQNFLNLWVASPTPDTTAGILRRASGQAFDQAADAAIRRVAMKTFAVRLVATLVVALATTSAALAQSRPPSCIPQYDASGALVAPYCGP